MSSTNITFADGVTVVIPFYNRSSFARRLLESVVEQTCKPSMVLFVDNGSKPGEVDALKNVIGSTNTRGIGVKYLASQRTGNANIARNLGMLKANTRYVAFLDSDDWWQPNHLEASLAALRCSGKTGVYSGSIVHSVAVYTNRSISIESVPTPFHLLFSREGWSAQTSTYVIDKARLRGVTWDERLRRHQDYDFFLAISFKADGWAFNSEPTGNLERNAAAHGRNFDFKSMIRFLQKWESNFPPDCMQIYLPSQMDACILSHASDRYYRYYRSMYLRIATQDDVKRLRSMKLFRSMRIRLIELAKRLKIYSILKKASNRT